MKLLVEFDTKAEMDAFFQASESGGIEAPREIALSNKTGQTMLMLAKPTALDGKGEVLVIELHQRGSIDNGVPLPVNDIFVVA